MVKSDFSKNVTLSFVCIFSFCELCALYSFLLRCDAYNVFMHCGTVLTLKNFWGASTR